MRILADENCDGAIVAALTAAGHDVNWISRTHPRAKDSFIFELAIVEKRVLLSQDQDFSRMLSQASVLPLAVVMMRFDKFPKALRPPIVVGVFQLYAARIPGHVIVIEPGRVRFRSLKQ